jgi:putative tryptophan/tyrosine transport system substrate-binding protein
MKKKTLKIVLFILSILSFSGIFSIFSGFSSALSGREPVIAVISSRQIKPYQDALAGFREELKRSGYNLSERYYNLDDFRGKAALMTSEISGLNPDLIFTIGTEASVFAKNNFKGLPVIFSMVLNPVDNGLINSLENPGNNLTGVALDILPEAQFRKLKEILPNVKRIGVIYNSREEGWITGVAAAANKLGLSVVALPIANETDIPAKLDKIAREADCLWAQTDSRIYNAQTSRYILLALIRNKIPLMAFSAQYVKAGALLSLECEYGDIGRESAQAAIKVLKGEEAGSIPVSFPVKLRLTVNKRIAQLLGIEIPPKLLEEAAEAY